MVATIVEKIYGTEAAVVHINISWWMIALWAIAAVVGIVYLCVVATYFGVNYLLGGLHSYA